MRNDETRILQIIPAPANLFVKYIEDDEEKYDIITCLALVKKKYSNGESYQEVKAMTGDGYSGTMVFADEISGYEYLKCLNEKEQKELGIVE